MPKHTITANCASDDFTVDATEHPCGLLTYRAPDGVDDGCAYHWRIGHHSGRMLAVGHTEDAVTAAVAVLAPLADWTADRDTVVGSFPDRRPPADVWQQLADLDVIEPESRWP